MTVTVPDPNDKTRPWYKRLTMIGVVFIGAAKTAEEVGLVPYGTWDTVSDLVRAVGELLVVTGVYRQVAK